ncbi:Uu.00g099340.m01.CDS01 [Anthostomella pinea]|uniref:Uu.00g099340.m01.CDS01 n=1 Tax=Anthostomella pinea TaxID=933095 RepID=A0AAI8VDR9_9PEZI|nr:Uu.00g099340.m01.CDS01 [Anthostomella pinea]
MGDQLTFLVAFATIFGASEAIRQIQSDARKKEHRSRKNNLIVRCLKSSQYSPTLEGRQVVLSGEKLYVDTGTDYRQPFGHPFAGYYLPFPDTPYSGLVSTICDEPPVMNWIYVDRETYELKFGNRAWAEPNWPGPFDCSRQDRRLTFGSWEGFLAVKEGDFWALYFDIDHDNLQSKVEEGTPVLEVVLLRIEMRTGPPKQEPADEGGSECTEAANGGAGRQQMQNPDQGSGKEGTEQEEQLDPPDVD